MEEGGGGGGVEGWRGGRWEVEEVAAGVAVAEAVRLVEEAEEDAACAAVRRLGSDSDAT